MPYNACTIRFFEKYDVLIKKTLFFAPFRRFIMRDIGIMFDIVMRDIIAMCGIIGRFLGDFSCFLAIMFLFLIKSSTILENTRFFVDFFVRK